MIDIKASLSKNMNPTDLNKLLHEYMDQIIKEIINKELEKYKVTVELSSYPNAMFSQLDSEFAKDHLYTIEAYGWVNNDGVYVAEANLMTSYNNKFKNGDTFIEFNRLKDYITNEDREEEKDGTVVAQIDNNSFAWKEAIEKITKKEAVNYIVSYPFNK